MNYNIHNEQVSHTLTFFKKKSNHEFYLITLENNEYSFSFHIKLLLYMFSAMDNIKKVEFNTKNLNIKFFLSSLLF